MSPSNRAGGPSRFHTEWRTAWRGHSGLLTGVATGLVALALVTIVSGIRFASSLQAGLPDRAAIDRIGEMAESTTVYDASDRPAFTIFKEQRIEVPLADISPHLLHAIVAIEDQRFYDHRGFDLIRMVSAALADIRNARVAQGGSTITQQLARQSFLTSDKTVRRKAQELILAARLERQYTKTDILELYLNKVYFGDGLYGVEAASLGYFGRHASELSLPQAALLAGLVKSPSTYAPTVSRDRAKARRNVVLQAMFESGAIERASWESARSAPVVLHDGLRSDEAHGQYFKEEVRRELVERFGWDRVYQGGLRVFSTIDVAMQAAAEAAVADGLKALDARRAAIEARRKKPVLRQPYDDDQLQAALVALDPSTGQVRAMVGGRDFEASSFNRAVQARRQPGSAFKPFVYATAIEQGFTPATLIDHLNDPVATVQGAWAPEDEHSTADSMTLRTGLRTSSNRAAVRLLQEVGIPHAVAYAKNLGVGDVPSVPSLALGSGEVTLESMTAAYAAFANRGEVPKALVIRRVEDKDGAVLYAAEDSSTRAISETTAYLMSTMLADVINAGTGARARSLGFTLPAAGKTGTTNEFKDAWFVGFTPKLVAGVWVGFDRPHTIFANGFAADVAVPLWADFMKSATRGDKPEWLPMPAGITTALVCRLSGQLATEGCAHVEVADKDGQTDRRSMVYTEYFLRGTEPIEYCELHRSRTRGIFGVIASIFHSPDPPPSQIDELGLPRVSAPAGTAGVAALEIPPVPSATADDPPKKKRGFWSRLFGVGKK
jgi:penicillin-binding protein 1A